MDQSNLLLDGAAAAAAPDNPQSQPQSQPQPQPQPLSAVAQMAYDRYGVLDPVKLDLMIRGIFITRDDAAALPNRITPDGRPEPNWLHASHHSRAPRSSSTSSHRNHHAAAAAAPRRAAATTAGAGIVKRLGTGAGAGVAVRARLREASSSSGRSSGGSASASGGANINAGPSDHEKWGEGAVESIIRMKAERVRFRDMAAKFPGKTQKAVQEKFYKSLKDEKWKRLYHQLRARHDGVAAWNNGTLEDPIEISSDEGTATQPIEISSGTVSEATTIAEPEEDRAEEFVKDEAEMEDVEMAD